MPRNVLTRVQFDLYLRGDRFFGLCHDRIQIVGGRKATVQVGTTTPKACPFGFRFYGGGVTHDFLSNACLLTNGFDKALFQVSVGMRHNSDSRSLQLGEHMMRAVHTLQLPSSFFNWFDQV